MVIMVELKESLYTCEIEGRIETRRVSEYLKVEITISAIAAGPDNMDNWGLKQKLLLKNVGLGVHDLGSTVGSGGILI
ncbi:hypothetical protein L1987_49392 [Smallanthus sonchifolius]|uniref:Uncharacterized protein n=1 Tax=Smallanthus sonchifolius TaxID=185202 RepID=A0ACB9FVL0_9ASTR|nr:hypothetical protein L1987_49392 [Smallanthus sonchifolius]